MKGSVPLVLAAIALIAGIAILLTPEMELGQVLGVLLLGFALAMGALGAARAVGGRFAVLVLASYAGAVVASIASRLLLGFRPLGLSDAPAWIAVLVFAGPVLAARESPLLVAVGAVAGLFLSILYEERRIPRHAD